MSHKVLGLDGKTYNWNLVKYTTNNHNPSSLHIKAREILKKLYPFDAILEEVALPGSTLIADFYIHRIKTVIEVHGEQHYTYNNFFFKDKKSFLQASQRDKQKQQWCEINSITYIELPYNKIEEWEWIISQKN